MRAEPLGHEVVTAPWEIDSDQVAVITLDLILPLDVPSFVVGDYEQSARAVSDSGVDLHAVKAEGTVAYQRHDPSVRT